MKKLSIKHLLILFLTTMLIVCLTSCEEDFENASTLKKLYKTYKNGSIDECKYNDQTVYRATLNVYDANVVIHDKNGKQIGTCNYAWEQFDVICTKLTDCETIYRCKDNIWGFPEIDKYGLGK
jgi:hypothetical protein